LFFSALEAMIASGKILCRDVDTKGLQSPAALSTWCKDVATEVLRKHHSTEVATQFYSNCENATVPDSISGQHQWLVQRLNILNDLKSELIKKLS